MEIGMSIIQNILKVALVIGNANYENGHLGVSPLNDARELTNVLKEKEFTIILKENLKSEEMWSAVDEFIEVIEEKRKTVDKFIEEIGDEVDDIEVLKENKEGSVALFYYAGHAVQIDGENYLLPIDNSFIDSDEAKRRSLGLSNLLDKINQKNPQHIVVILDACRDNPYNPSWLSLSDEKNDLVEIASAGKRNLIVSYATTTGKKSFGGASHDNHGIYTKHLLKVMRNTFGLKIEDVFKKVSACIEKENHVQVPCIMNYQIDDLYLDSLSVTERRSIIGSVFSIDVYQNNILAAVGKECNYIELYKVRPFRFLACIKDEENNWGGDSVSFSPDGRLAIGCTDGTIRLWRLDETFKQIHSSSSLKGHKRDIFSICFSPNGRLLASASSDMTIQLWDIENECLICTFDESKEHFYGVTFSPDGKIFVSASSEGIDLWDLDTKKLTKKIREHLHNDCYVVAFSPDGKFLASGGMDLKIWDTNSWEVIHTLQKTKGSDDSIIALTFSPNGEVLVSGDNHLKLWDVSTGTHLQSLNGLDKIYSVSYSSDGQTISAICVYNYYNSKFKVWDKSVSFLNEKMT